MIVDGEVNAVIAPVAVSALPDAFTTWNGRTVLVNGSCRARVVGFAEVSSISGEPYGSEEYWSTPEDERPAEQPTWQADDIVADNVTLAAKLDGCTGTWARSTDYEAAQAARAIDAPAFEADAIADLVAHAEETGGGDQTGVVFAAISAGGRPYRVVVSLLGLAVALLSLSGVWIWWKKRARGERRSASPRQ